MYLGRGLYRFDRAARLLPTPASDRRAALVAKGGEGATALFDSLEPNRLAWEEEQRAIALARGIAEGGTGLDRMSTAEKVDAIVSRKAGLGPLASVEMLHDIGQHNAADEFQRRYFRDVGAASVCAGEGNVARAASRIEATRRDRRWRDRRVALKADLAKRSAKTANNVLTALSACLKFAGPEGLKRSEGLGIIKRVR